ncbi:hypothetical protein [Clostridium sp. YIM B02569]|uniref:hypothetical protein n=1 Tax=Clostridium sp. YIM B02569 TaxID=2911967 RepID=UPI001EEE25F0|nr:hypothetical protein [Clostridium sp. YIM B02569]
MNNDELKIKHIKLKLHFIYCGIIAIAIGVCLFTVRNYSNSDMAVQFSFGATLVGIVLSVIAIFMSIMGEKDMSLTKDKLVSVSDDLIEITNRLHNSMNDINNILMIRDEINQSNQEILNKLDQSLNDSRDYNNKVLDTILIHEFFFGDDDNILLKSSVGILYFYKKNYEMNDEEMTIPRNIEIFKTILNSNEESMIWLLLGMNVSFFKFIINAPRFSEYIEGKIQMYPEIKKRVNKILKEK